MLYISSYKDVKFYIKIDQLQNPIMNSNLFIGNHQKNFDRDFNIYLTDYLDI